MLARVRVASLTRPSCFRRRVLRRQSVHRIAVSFCKPILAPFVTTIDKLYPGYSKVVYANNGTHMYTCAHIPLRGAWWTSGYRMQRYFVFKEKLNNLLPTRSIANIIIRCSWTDTDTVLSSHAEMIERNNNK